MEPIIVALIGVVGSILVILIEKGRKENTRDHGIVAEKLSEVKLALQDIDQDVEHIEQKIDSHLRDHSFGGFDLDDNYLSNLDSELFNKKAKKKKKNVSKKR